MSIMPFLFMDAEKYIIGCFKLNNALSLEDALLREELNIDFKKNPTTDECFRDMVKRKKIEKDSNERYWLVV